MPRAERLSTRLETLLETVFQSPADPFSLYWDIAARIGPEEVAQVQRTLRKKLKERDRISPETAILAACLMNLGGFPPQRILHFISVYVPRGIRPSLFELAVGAIFLGEPPIPASLVYDLTQYTYLEKRLLVRKSMEISERLADSTDPRALLYLYLLALRDDLSNEHVQLIALVLKKCIPSRELRGRIGSASLEEYGEIARAVNAAEDRSRDLDLAAEPGSGRVSGRFSRDSASFFLDKYFSDEAIAEARASAPEIRKRPPAARPAPRVTVEPAPAPRAVSARTRKDGDAVHAPPALDTDERTAARTPARAREPARAQEPARAREPAREPTEPREGRVVERRNASRAAPLWDGSAEPPRVARAPQKAAAVVERRRRPSAAHLPAPGKRAGPPGAWRGPGLIALPPLLAVVVLAILLGLVPAGLRSSPTSPGPADARSAVGGSSPGGSAVAVETGPGRGQPSSPAPMTYVVKPGDSLWKIFRSLQSGADRGGWQDFLSQARTANGLGDPDQLQPGRVLTLSAPR